jgi:hypothetical protein
MNMTLAASKARRIDVSSFALAVELPCSVCRGHEDAPAGAAGHSVLIAIVNVYLASEFAFSAFNPTSISRRIASGLPGWSG